MGNEQKLQETFKESLVINNIPDFNTLTYQGIKEWDSVAHMSLIAALEDKFSIMIDTDDVVGMSSYSKAREILQKYGVEF